MRKASVVLIAVLFLFAVCDGPDFEYEQQCQENDTFNPNLVDPYSVDTNWYIDDVGNIVWKH